LNAAVQPGRQCTESGQTFRQDAPSFDRHIGRALAVSASTRRAPVDGTRVHDYSRAPSGKYSARRSSHSRMVAQFDLARRGQARKAPPNSTPMAASSRVTTSPGRMRSIWTRPGPAINRMKSIASLVPHAPRNASTIAMARRLAFILRDCRSVSRACRRRVARAPPVGPSSSSQPTRGGVAEAARRVAPRVRF
jgi:hypothetical protein